jgi:hypothetical protein
MAFHREEGEQGQQEREAQQQKSPRPPRRVKVMLGQRGCFKFQILGVPGPSCLLPDVRVESSLAHDGSRSVAT